MKIYENKIEIDFFKILLTDNIFKCLQMLISKNKKSLVITPQTKLNEILQFKSGNPLMNKILIDSSDLQTNLIDQTQLNKILDSINDNFEDDLIEQKMEYIKILKTLFEIRDLTISDDMLSKVLEFLNKNTQVKIEVIIIGYEFKEYYKMENIDILWVLDRPSKNINLGMLEALMIDQKDSVFEVENIDLLVKWIEATARLRVDREDLSDYFSGKTTFNTFLIEKAIRQIK